MLLVSTESVAEAKASVAEGVRRHSKSPLGDDQPGDDQPGDHQ